MKKIKIYNQSKAVFFTSNAALADTFFRRFLGLMWRKNMPLDYCLMIQPCNQVHMMNMRFPIDVIYLDKNHIVIDIDRDLQPWKIGRKRSAAKGVLECHAGYTDDRLTMGDQLIISQSM